MCATGNCSGGGFCEEAIAARVGDTTVIGIKENSAGDRWEECGSGVGKSYCAWCQTTK